MGSSSVWAASCCWGTECHAGDKQNNQKRKIVPIVTFVEEMGAVYERQGQDWHLAVLAKE